MSARDALKTIAEQAEAIAAPKVASLLKAPADKPLIKGRMTVFVFDQRYDYAEFGNMVDDRELPKSLRGHFVASPVEVYGGGAIPSKSTEYAADVLMAKTIPPHARVLWHTRENASATLVQRGGGRTGRLPRSSPVTMRLPPGGMGNRDATHPLQHGQPG